MNEFGKIFKVSFFGESHGPAVGVVIDGVPAGLPIHPEDFEADIARRKPGAKGTTTRVEDDIPVILSGVFNDHATGDPIAIIFWNKNVSSKDYNFVLDTPRPGHADFVASRKSKRFNDYRGGGFFSARRTVSMVAAGVIAKKIIAPIKIDAKIVEIGGTSLRPILKADLDTLIPEQDSIGGIIECIATKMPVGLGEPPLYGMKQILCQILHFIPAIEDIGFGVAYSAAKMRGSDYNDCFIDANGKTVTNHCGGINGGISNGNDLVFTVAIKPTSSIPKKQTTFNFRENKMTDLEIKGRHDACIALRAPVIIEAATAIALADLTLLGKAKA